MTTIGVEPLKSVCVATDSERLAIYRLRHDVFAGELGQHATNESGTLSDYLDGFNVYIVLKRGDEVCGHISLTPPNARGYSIEKYIQREKLPFEMDDKTYEARLLTVRDVHRGSGDAILLMYAAYKWVRERGGLRIIAMGRKEVLPLYEKSGFARTGMEIRSGAVDYELIIGTIEGIAQAVEQLRGPLAKALEGVDWNLETQSGDGRQTFGNKP